MNENQTSVGMPVDSDAFCLLSSKLFLRPLWDPDRAQTGPLCGAEVWIKALCGHSRICTHSLETGGPQEVVNASALSLKACSLIQAHEVQAAVVWKARFCELFHCEIEISADHGW